MVDQIKNNDSELGNLRVCWFGSARYSQPLNDSQARKWEALTQLGADLHVVGFSDNALPKKFYQNAHFYLLPQSRFSPIRHITLLILGILTLFWIRIRYGCNVFIAQSPYEGMVCACVTLISKFFGKRTVNIIESHNDFEETLFLQRKVTGAKAHRTLMRYAVLFSLKRADLFRPVSSSTSAQLSTTAPAKPQVRFMAWTDASAFSPCKENRLPDPNIVYAGVLVPRKCVHNLIIAFANCQAIFPHSRLKIIGEPTNADYAKRLRNLVEELRISEKVQFYGSISQKELGAHFSNARCSVLPSSSEGLGRVLIESQLSGTPVIATCVGGIPDVVLHGETGFLIPAEDPEALAEAMGKMLSMDAISWQKMSDKARKIANQTFSTQAYVSGYRKLLTLAQDLLN